MAEMIQLGDPLSVAAQGIGDYLTAKRNLDLKAKAQQYQQSRDARKDMEADRSFGLDQSRAADEHATTESNLQTAAQNRAIAEAQEAYRKSVEPEQRKLLELQIKVEQGNASYNDLRQQQAKLDLVKSRVDAQITQKYGPQMAAIALQQAQANVAQTQASTAASNAATALDTKRTQLLGTQAAGGYGTASKADPFAVRESLPPEIQALMDKVERGTTTREDVYRYVQANPQMRQYLPAVEYVFNKKGVQQPSYSARKADQKRGATDATNATMAGYRQRLASLPAPVQLTIEAMLKKGASPQGVLEMVDSSKMDDATKKAIHAALDPAGASQAAVPQGTPGWNLGDIMGRAGGLVP